MALQIWNRSGELRVHQVLQFLAEAMSYFKELPDDGNPKTQWAYGDAEKSGRRTRYIILLANADKTPITRGLCVEAVIDAHAKANIISAMVDNRLMCQDAINRDGSHLLDLVDMLDKPGGDLLALRELCKRLPSR